MKKIKSISFAALYLVIPFAVQLLIGLMLSVQILLMQWKGNAISQAFLEELQNNYGFNMILIALVDLILTAGMGTWYYFIRRRQNNPKVSYRKIFSPRSIGYLAVMALFAQFICNLILLGFSMLTPEIFRNYEQLMKMADINVLPAWATLFIVGVWAPLAEEIVFRAMIFRTLRKGFTFVPAAVISGAAFGFYHLNLIQGVYAGLFGVLLAYIYEKTDSLAGVYLFHLMFNLMNYGISFVGQLGIPEMVLGGVTLILMLSSVPGLILCLYQFSKLFQKK